MASTTHDNITILTGAEALAAVAAVRIVILEKWPEQIASFEKKLEGKTVAFVEINHNKHTLNIETEDHVIHRRQDANDSQRPE